MTAYKPRRQGKRWLDADCPAGVLAIYDNRGRSFDRYTVFYSQPCEGTTRQDMWLWYRSMSEHPSSAQGFGIAAQLKAWEVAAYRYRASKEACKWSDLPEDVKAAVRADCQDLTEEEQS